MKFRIDRAPFLAVVRRCAPFCASKGVHPIYESILLTAEGDRIAVAATDLENAIETSTTAVVLAPGAVAIKGADLSTLLARLPDGAIDVTLDAESMTTTFKIGKSSHKLKGHSKADFPEIVRPDEKSAVELPASGLVAAFAAVEPAISKETMRYALVGALVRVKGGTIDVVGTDGRRLSLVTLQTPSAADWQAIVPRKFVGLVRALDPDGDARISVARCHFFVETDEARLCSRTVEGMFPNYGDVIPKDGTMHATCNREELMAAISRCDLSTAEEGKDVAARFEIGESLRITTRSPDREAEEFVELSGVGPAVTFGLQPSFLLDALKALSGETVTLVGTNAAMPWTMREAGRTLVVMPVAL